MKVFGCFLTFIIVFVFPCMSQEEQTLVNWIEAMEQSSGIKFSYADENIAPKKLILDQHITTFDLLIKAVERQTALHFEPINETHYVIRPFDQNDSVSVCGQVIDPTGKPIEGALIVADTLSKGDITDREGYFYLDHYAYTDVVTIRHLGMNTRRVSIAELFSKECTPVKMLESVGFLEELTVRDYLSIGIIKERNHVKIFPGELKILPGLTEPDILQSIQLVPGIISPYETASGLHVRGGSPDQNLVLWNGIKTYNQGHFFGMLSAFNPYITDEVVFIKNGTSAQYGERVSSVIDITSANEIPEKLSGGAGFNMIYGDAYLNLPIIKDQLSVNMSGRRSYTDILKTFTYKRFSDRVFQNTKIAETPNNQQATNRFFFNDFTTGVTFKPFKDHQIRFNSLFDKNTLHFSSLNDSTNESFDDRLNTSNEGYHLKWAAYDQKPFSFNVEGYYSRYLLSYEFISTLNDSSDIAFKKNLIRDYGASICTQYNISEDQQLITGYQYTHNRIRYAFENETPSYTLVLDENENQIDTHALYAEYSLNSEHGTNLSAGLRTNHYSELSQTTWEPRLFLQQRVNGLLSLNISGEYRTQVASQIKESVVSDLSLENQVWTLASRDGFPLIKSYQVTSGAILSANNWYLDMEGYYKQIRGITTLTFGFLNPVGNEFSRGDSNIKGGDVFIKKQFDHYKSWLAYSYMYAENEFFDLNNGTPFPGNWNIEHTIKWSHFYHWNHFHLSLGWLWHTGKAYTYVTEINDNGPVTIQYDRINENNLPVYHRLDFSMVYEFSPNPSKSLTYRLGISILNLYNRKNQLNREYRTTPSLNNRLIETRIYSLGITPNLVFRVFI